MSYALTVGERILRKKAKSTVAILYTYLDLAQLMFERKKNLLF